MAWRTYDLLEALGDRRFWDHTAKSEGDSAKSEGESKDAEHNFNCDFRSIVDSECEQEDVAAARAKTEGKAEAAQEAEADSVHGAESSSKVKITTEDLIKWSEKIKRRKDVFSFDTIRETFGEEKSGSATIIKWGKMFRQVYFKVSLSILQLFFPRYLIAMNLTNVCMLVL